MQSLKFITVFAALFGFLFLSAMPVYSDVDGVKKIENGGDVGGELSEDNIKVQDGSEESKQNSVKLEPDTKESKKIPSLFFTFWQHQSILKAKRSRGAVKAPTQEELDALNEGDGLEPPVREVALGGIVYDGPKDWTIWINNQRVTPDAVPKEALDLHVFKDYIEVQWIDDYTNQVFPLRLRAHQRFNLDTRIFLTGESYAE